MPDGGNGNGGGATRIMSPGSAWGSHLKSVMGFPYLPRLNNALIEVSAPGACDPDMKQILARLASFRFATVLFRWTRVGVNLNHGVVTYQIFNQGPGEGGLTGSETNAVEQGGLVPSGTRWYSVGAKVAWQAPYQVAAGADPTGARFYPVNLQASVPTNGYGKRAAQALADSTYAEINHGTGNACRYSMSSLGLWNDGVGDGSNAFNMNGGVPGQFLWFSTPDESTGKNEDGALRMTVQVTHDLTLENDALNPTTAQVDMILPMKISLIGFPLCEPRYCAPSGAVVSRADLRDALRDLLKDPQARAQLQAGL